MAQEELVGIYTGWVWFKGVMNSLDNGIENVRFLAATIWKGTVGNLKYKATIKNI